jgi:hypothetical protein
MKWLLRLYPAGWRARYGEEFAEVLERQRPSIGMFMDVLGGAVDAHLHPQFNEEDSTGIQGEKAMTLAMFVRCAAGGPKLSGQDRRKARLYMLASSAVCALIYLVLTKLYHSAAPVQAFGAAACPAVFLVYEQTAYLRRRPWRTQAVVLVGGVSAMYLGMLAVCLIANRL